MRQQFTIEGCVLTVRIIGHHLVPNIKYNNNIKVNISIFQFSISSYYNNV